VEGVKSPGTVSASVLCPAFFLAPASPASAEKGKGASIRTAHHGPGEDQTADQLRKLIGSYDLRKSKFTRDVTIDRGAMNQDFPESTVNARFADVPDDCTYGHLLDCYLGIEADGQLIAPERAPMTIKNKTLHRDLRNNFARRGKDRSRGRRASLTNQLNA
jgi:hypothetical protein